MRKVNKMLLLLSHFSTNTWNFDSDNVANLWKCMSEKDRQLFHFNLGSINWSKYWEQSVKHGRVYLVHDPLETLPYARKKMRILAVVHYVVMAIFVYLCFKVFQMLFSFMF